MSNLGQAVSTAINSSQEYTYINPNPTPPPLPPPTPKPAVGRNDPCPCGSGKKFKKCCLLKDFDAESEKRMQEDLEWEKWFEEDHIRGEKALAEYTLDFSYKEPL